MCNVTGDWVIGLQLTFNRVKLILCNRLNKPSFYLNDLLFHNVPYLANIKMWDSDCNFYHDLQIRGNHVESSLIISFLNVFVTVTLVFWGCICKSHQKCMELKRKEEKKALMYYLLVSDSTSQGNQWRSHCWFRDTSF